MAGGCCIGGGLVALVFGITLLVLGFAVIPPVVNHAQTKGVKENIVVDSNTSTEYYDWAQGIDEKTDYQMVFHFYNLTNLDDVATNGKKPIYTEHGPYIYRRHRKSINVSFDDGGNLLRYSNLKDYTFQPELSVGPDTDQFVNINPVYLAALAQTHGEVGMLIALSPEFIRESIDFLTGPFIPLFFTYVSPPVLDAQVNATLESLMASNVTDPTTYFLSSWANAITPPEYGGDWKGMLISASGGVASGIPTDTARRLFDPQEPYSLFSTDPDVAWIWANAKSDPNNILLSTFSLTPSQLAMIIDWRVNDFARVFLHQYYILEYQLEDITDLGWVQWWSGGPLDGQSVNTLFSNLSNPMGVSWEFFEGPDAPYNSFPSWQFSKSVMNSTSGLTNTYVFQDWLNAESAQETDFSAYGLNQTQSDGFFSFCFQLGAGFSFMKLSDLYGPTGGLFRTKSVYDWVFNCEEYILPILQPDALPCSVYQNHTYFPRTTIWTGKDDVQKINEYVEWREMTQVTDVWAGPLNVSGHTASGQFQPNIAKTDEVVAFDINLVRPLTFKYNKTTSVKGVKTYRYLLDWNKTFAVDPFFYQSIFGLANLTSWQQGAPIFLSLWDMAQVANRTDWVDGLNTTTGEYEYNTVLDIEPITGTTLFADQKLQINIYLPPEAKAFFRPSLFGNNPKTGIAYPLMKAGEKVMISDDLIKKLKDPLHLVSKVRKVNFWVCVTLGPVLVILGIVMVVIGARRRQENYELIN